VLVRTTLEVAVPLAARKFAYLGAMAWAFAVPAVVGVPVATAAEPSPTPDVTASAAPGASPTSCQGKITAVTDGSGPIARFPEVAVIDSMTITNDGDAALADAWIRFQLILNPFQGTDVPPDVASAPPSLSWSIDGGAWHAMRLDWQPQAAPNLSYWLADGGALPTLAAGTRHSVRLRMAFRETNPESWYLAYSTIGASCTSSAWARNAFSYYPSLVGGGLPENGKLPKASAPVSPSATPSPSMLPTALTPTAGEALAPMTQLTGQTAAHGWSTRTWLVVVASAAVILLAAVTAVKALRARRMFR
jgi:hypothetical protein